jgi:hypothetical protein
MGRAGRRDILLGMRKRLLALLFSLPPAAFGCSAAPRSTPIATPVVVVVEGSPGATPDGGRTFSGEDLDRLVREYAAVHAPGFPFAGTRASVLVPGSRAYLADVLYTPERDGAQTLIARVDFDGKVRVHRVATAVFCATGRTDLGTAAAEPRDWAESPRAVRPRQ